jgi:UPF0271 protein
VSAQPRLLDVNVGMGESFGRWRLGDDAALMPYISSVNIACGFHAGDPVTMRATVRPRWATGFRLAAHVALPELREASGKPRRATRPAPTRAMT